MRTLLIFDRGILSRYFSGTEESLSASDTDTMDIHMEKQVLILPSNHINQLKKSHRPKYKS